jgi:hypothetical protein
VPSTPIWERHVFRSVRRACLPIATIALTYLVFLVIGIGMTHAGSRFALTRRDGLVRHGETHDRSAIAFQEGRLFKAIAIEFGRDCYRALVKTLEGLTVILPYPFAARNGWYGGILSVDSQHLSQLREPFSAIYYVIFEVLQIISSALAAGAGVNLTLACLRSRPCYQGEKWLVIPKEAIRDLLRIYLIVLPLILISAVWKYFVP